MSKGYEGIKKKETKKEEHPKSKQGAKIEKAFKRNEKEDERPIRKAQKGLGIPLKKDVTKHKKDGVK